MRVIIAGSRDTTRQDVFDALDTCPWVGFISAVVSGTARGVDTFGEEWAKQRDIDVITYPAEWKKYGKRAGPIRNETMARNAEGLVAVWDGKSRGTASMVELAKRRGLRIDLFRTDLRKATEIAPCEDVANLWDHAEERAGFKEFAAGLDRFSAEREAGAETLAMCRSLYKNLLETGALRDKLSRKRADVYPIIRDVDQDSLYFSVLLSGYNQDFSVTKSALAAPEGSDETSVKQLFTINFDAVLEAILTQRKFPSNSTISIDVKDMAAIGGLRRPSQ